MLFEDFLQNSSSQSLGKFGEFLFEEFCKQEKINCKREHEGGVDFIIKSNIKVDVKAVRHIKVNSKERFRRHNTEKQLPGVHYAYIIFWKNSIQLRFEYKDLKFGNYDSFLKKDLIDSTWTSFDKKSIKFVDKEHFATTKRLKAELTDWIKKNLGIKARVIQRNFTSALALRSGGGWGADNFYKKPPHKHDIVVLLSVAGNVVKYIHSYPTSEYNKIPIIPKPVGTNRKPIFCYVIKELPDKYKFKDIDDFKCSVKERFNISVKK